MKRIGILYHPMKEAAEPLARKLEGFLESSLLRAFREVGLRLAQKLSLVAQKWGNKFAKSWAFDISFGKFLAVMYINEPKAFKT